MDHIGCCGWRLPKTSSSRLPEPIAMKARAQGWVEFLHVEIINSASVPLIDNFRSNLPQNGVTKTLRFEGSNNSIHSRLSSFDSPR